MRFFCSIASPFAYLTLDTRKLRFRVPNVGAEIHCLPIKLKRMLA